VSEPVARCVETFETAKVDTDTAGYGHLGREAQDDGGFSLKSTELAGDLAHAVCGCPQNVA
jgi:hypothetical protein